MRDNNAQLVRPAAVIVLSALTPEQLDAVARDLLAFVEGQPELDLTDLAFSLQVGRAALEHRLAFSAGSLDAVAGGLAAHLHDGGAGLCYGHVSEPVTWDEQDEQLRETIESLIASGDHQALADMWVGGAAVDWPRLYAPHKPFRIPLPTYPFAKERYWVTPGQRPEQPGAAALHPLLHSNVSGLDTVAYTSTFTGGEPFLADHRVHGDVLLPGAAFLEMALAATAAAGVPAVSDGAGVALTDIVWLRPLRVADGNREVRATLRVDGDGAVRFEATATESGVETVHCAAAVSACEAIAETLPLTEMQARYAGRRAAGSEVYTALRSAGLDYGEFFRALDHLLIGSDEALARLVLSAVAHRDRAAYRLHPSLLDGALQACSGMLSAAGGGVAGGTLVPFGADRVEVLDQAPATAWAWARRSAAPDAADGTNLRFDIDLCDDSGAVWARVRGLVLRALSGPAEQGTVLAIPAWREQALTGPTSDAVEGHREVVFVENSGQGDEDLPEGVHLVSDATTIGARYADYAVQILDTTRALLRDGTRTAYLQIVLADRPQPRLLTGLGALLRTAHLETPAFTGQVVLLADGVAESDRAALLKRERDHRAEGTVRLRPGMREVLTFTELQPGQRPTVPWRAGGVYLITGGLGGLGRIVAEEIATQVRDTTLILTGRSPASARSRRIIEGLRASGARAFYTSLDVTDRAGVRGLVEQILSTSGALHGVVHAAGVIDDDFVLRKTEPLFRAVLAPKVTGLVHLDEATRDVDLDFFVTFSSGAAVTGSVGQVDYASANAFMDAYAAYRAELVSAGQRKGRSLSINWPLWADGGMHAGTGTEASLRDRYGVVPLSRHAGIAALSSALQTSHSQVLVAAGDQDRIREALDPRRPNKDWETVSVQTDGNALQGPQDDLSDRAMAYLASLLSDVLKVPAHRVEPSRPLERYGIDSVMALSLTSRLESVFGPLPKTLFFEYRDIKGLSGYFLDAHAARLREVLGAPEAPAVALAQVVEPAPAPAAVSAPTLLGHGGPADIAVIGLAGRYPQARNLGEFWRNLVEGRDSVTEVPVDRWDLPEQRELGTPQHMRWGGFLDDVDKFDPLFFNMSPREAEVTDPQERLFLECVYETLQDAGYTRAGVASSVGVFVGAMYDEYQLYGATAEARAEGRLIPGNAANIANRVSYFCDWQGPSMTVKTMCSSSLTAVHLACQSLRLGECEVAVAGGVNLSLHSNKFLLLEQTGFTSSRGRCESFGEGGDGYVPAEGVGAVLLKPLAQAITDNDRIYGVIKATAVNHGGRTNGYTVPNPQAQGEVIARAMDGAGVDARAVSYVEAHGTGTALGDPIEIAGLTKAFSRHTEDRQYCAIGSVKSNIGHAESAAGISALTKVLLQLKYGRLVPSLHAETLNPHIDFSETPFRVQRQEAEWQRPVVATAAGPREYPRIAGVSSFGAGGSNAHVILAEHVPAHAAADPASSVLVSIVLLSARTKEQLREQARRLLDWVRDERLEDADLPGVTLTLQVGREHMDERLAFTADNVAELVAGLRAFLDGDNAAPLYRGRVKRAGSTMSLLADDEDMARTVGAWIEKRKFGKLLELWVDGLDVPWRRFHPVPLPRRVSLPTYPFARERFWLPTRPASSVKSAISAPMLAKVPKTVKAPVSTSLTEPAGVPASVTAKPSGIALTPLDVAADARPAPLRTATQAVTLTAMDEVPSARDQAPSEPGLALEGVARGLVSTLAEALYMAEDDIDPDTNFTDLGLDSIVGVEWVKVINKRFGVELAATRLYDAPTVRQLSAYICGLPRTASATEPEVSEPDAGEEVAAERIQAELVSTLAEALYMAEDDIDPDTNFTDLGLDSIVGVEWVKVINKRFGVELAATRLYDHLTVLRLAENIHSELCRRGATMQPPVPHSEQECAEHEATDDETAQRVPAAAPTDAIAVVGMAGRYPRSANLDEFWDNLAEGRDCIGEVPKSRWDVDEYYDPRPNQRGKVSCRSLGYLDDIDEFDPLFFRIPPAEAESMDPQQRLFLQEAYHAFEDAGYDPRALSGRKCGVYLGIMSNEYSMLLQKQGGESAATSNSNAITAARISYILDLRGPAIALDTACSSSLVATHLAGQALRSGEIDMALVGGVTLYLSADAYLSMSSAGMLSPSGRCKTFDDSADGFVPGEGVGALVLKRLSDAIRDGDHVHGVVLGSGINQDGRTNGITAPSVTSQVELERDVYERYGIDPAGIGYVDMHGTGTKLGDPIELEALATVYRERTDATGYCAIGSVKSNIGHTSAAAGIASIQKALLCMQHQQLVPTLHFERPNEHFDLASSPFRVNTELTPWTESGTPRRAAVSGFGFSGTNAHLVLQEHQQVAADRPDDSRAIRVFVLSARSEQQLRTSARRLGEHLRSHPGVALADVAYTLQTGREAMTWRLAAVGTTRRELVDNLLRYAGTGHADAVLVRQATKARAREEALTPDTDTAGAMTRDEAVRIAEAWIDGAPVDWLHLYPHGQARRVPLPTYPFARERYWLAAPNRGPEPATVSPASAPANADAIGASRNILLRPVWDAVPRSALPNPVSKPTTSGRVVIINGTAEHADRVRALYPAAEHLAVGPGDTAEAIAGRLGAQGSLRHLFWLVPGDGTVSLRDDAVVAAQEAGIYACFRTLKALLSLGYGGHTLDITLITERTLRIRPAEVAQPAHSGLHGLLGSVANEYPRWTVRLADLDLDGDWPLAQLLALPLDDPGSSWAYRRGRWYRQTLLPVQDTAEQTDRPVYRQGGTYVVVGGAGGIGEAWTEHLLRHYGAQVIWIGRRAVDETLDERLRRLGEFGPRPRYVRADAADRESLQRAYEEIKRDYPTVHGVVHSAIVLLDQGLEHMDEERFRTAVRAKVDVSVRLAQVFGHEPLDFLLFFSSMNSFLRAAGQCNYVAGSVFEDSYAQRLGSEVTASVRIMNWGYWGGVGIVATPQYRERMIRAGAASIEPADGMAALDQLLSGSFDQLGLVKAHGGNA